MIYKKHIYFGFAKKYEFITRFQDETLHEF